MNLEWITSPLWLIINALAAYRLTRLWVEDMLPPLPRVRDRIEQWADQRHRLSVSNARLADNEDARERGEDPKVQRSVWGRGPREERTEETHALYGGLHPVMYLVQCAWCSGYWIALAVVLAASLIPATVWAFLAVPLAFSATTGLLHTAAEK